MAEAYLPTYYVPYSYMYCSQNEKRQDYTTTLYATLAIFQVCEKKVIAWLVVHKRNTEQIGEG